MPSPNEGAGCTEDREPLRRLPPPGVARHAASVTSRTVEKGGVGLDIGCCDAAGALARAPAAPAANAPLRSDTITTSSSSSLSPLCWVAAWRFMAAAAAVVPLVQPHGATPGAAPHAPARRERAAAAGVSSLRVTTAVAGRRTERERRMQWTCNGGSYRGGIARRWWCLPYMTPDTVGRACAWGSTSPSWCCPGVCT